MQLAFLGGGRDASHKGVAIRTWLCSFLSPLILRAYGVLSHELFPKKFRTQKKSHKTAYSSLFI